MVRVLLVVSPDGLLRSFDAEGHAGAAAAGSNIACAAITMLLRTAGRLCTAHGIAQDGGCGEPGAMRLAVSTVTPAHREWLRGVTDFVVRGVSDLQSEFPREIALRMEMTEV